MPSNTECDVQNLLKSATSAGVLIIDNTNLSPQILLVRHDYSINDQTVSLWGNFAGKLQENETVWDCAMRELREEGGSFLSINLGPEEIHRWIIQKCVGNRVKVGVCFYHQLSFDEMARWRDQFRPSDPDNDHITALDIAELLDDGRWMVGEQLLTPNNLWAPQYLCPVLQDICQTRGFIVPENRLVQAMIFGQQTNYDRLVKGRSAGRLAGGCGINEARP